MKKTLSILLTIILILSFASCNQDGNIITAPSTQDTKPTTPITPTTPTTPTTTTPSQGSPVEPPEEEKYSDGLEFTLNSDGEGYSVTGIGSCTDVDIVIPDEYEGLPVIAISDNAFKNNSDIQSLTTGDSLVTIGAYAFQNCTSLTSIYFLDSFVSMGEYAFENCDSLAYLFGGKNFKDFPLNAFQGCYKLADIEIDEENPYYLTVDGSFYSKDGTVLLRYAVGKKDTHFSIPDTVIQIGEQSFYGATNLKTITIPNSVTTIGSLAFGYCISLESITIPETVTTIGSLVFTNSMTLSTINFEGTVSQWQGIYKFYWAVNMGDYVIYCSDGNITKGGTITYQ